MNGKCKFIGYVKIFAYIFLFCLCLCYDDEKLKITNAVDLTCKRLLAMKVVGNSAPNVGFGQNVHERHDRHDRHDRHERHGKPRKYLNDNEIESEKKRLGKGCKVKCKTIKLIERIRNFILKYFKMLEESIEKIVYYHFSYINGIKNDPMISRKQMPKMLFKKYCVLLLTPIIVKTCAIIIFIIRSSNLVNTYASLEPIMATVNLIIVQIIGATALTTLLYILVKKVQYDAKQQNKPKIRYASTRTSKTTLKS
ncbi:Plasmodium exported protein, unknown function [Plasmodium vivax]|uniref:Uncharacterized protein n=1 Tax=Plasmodium vivax TaxID=5855 RepID=A0A565A473_PLAVI|nr:Plasmodium exported protein, unknown function [Plasmodium vivax]